MVFRTVKTHIMVFWAMILRSLVGSMNVLEEYAASVMLVGLPTYQTTLHHNAIGKNITVFLTTYLA
jgi:hypothetical protein